MEQVSQYGVEFFRVSSRNVQIQASSPNLAIYLGTFTSDITQIEESLIDVDFTLNDRYDLLQYDNREWTRELGTDLYSGRINKNKTFDLFMDDYYKETVESFPLYDIKVIFASLLKFLQKS